MKIEERNSHVEKDARGFGSHLSEPTRSGMLKVQFPLGDGLGGYDMSGEVLLHRFSGTNLHYIAVSYCRTTARGGMEELTVVGMKTVNIVASHDGAPQSRGSQ